MSPFKFAFSSSILESPTPSLDDHYELGHVLGKGHFGVVKTCTAKSTGDRLACKTVRKSNLKCWEEREDVRREVEIMELLGKHPNIVSLRGAFEDTESVHLVMDCCDGGELFDEISSRGPLSEAHSAQALQGIALALVHCHQKGVLHRDLKPENILLMKKPERQRKLEVKLADFGLSVQLKEGQAVSGLAGSPYYLAPEVLAGSYGLAADIWSLGVVLYMMLSETAPFYGETEREILDSIRKADLRFTGSNWEKVSESAKDLVVKMLQRDPKLRPLAKDVLQHPWVVRHTTEQLEASKQPLNIPRYCSSTPPPRTGGGLLGCTPALGADVVGVNQCLSLPRVNSRASDLLTWLSPQLAGASGGDPVVSRTSGVQTSAPLLHKFNEVMSELEDGIHYFVLEESADEKTGGKDLLLQLAQVEEVVESKPSYRQPEAQSYEPTPADALDWIFGL